MPCPEPLKKYAMTLGFPESENLARIFRILYRDEDEIALAAALPGTISELASRLKMPEPRVREIADRMLKRGAIHHPLDKPDFLRRFPVMIELRDSTVLWPEAPEELFHLWDNLIMKETAALIPVLKNLKVPPIVRVLPIERAVEAQNTVLDVDSARQIFKDAELITVIPCACRLMAKKNGRGQSCPAPEDAVCLQTHAFAQAVLDRGLGRRISNAEALRRVGLAEDAGLVHQVRNNIKRDMFMCNCCSCCCTGLYFVNELGYAQGSAASRFQVKLDEDSCSACGICEDRCQFHAIAIEDTAVINLDRCYGCGNCVIACPEEALKLVELRPLGHIRVK